LVRAGIRKFAVHNGMPNLFHETITTAWVSLLATHDEPTFDQFILENEHRLNREMLHRFWTPSVLDSDAARTTWLPPDKAALPT
jgi:4-alpha-glucanotransferase